MGEVAGGRAAGPIPLEAAQPYHCGAPPWRQGGGGSVGPTWRFGHPPRPALEAGVAGLIRWHSKRMSANSIRLGVSTPRPGSVSGAMPMVRNPYRIPSMAAVSLSVSTVKPLGDRIFIKVSESEEKTAGGILLPDTAKEKPQVGEVVQVGPGKRNDDGTRQAPEVSVGDKVLYSKYAGTDIKLGTDEYVLLSEKDILAIVN